MKMNRAVWIAAMAAGLLLAGCGQQQPTAWEAKENSIYVTRTMEVQSALVYRAEQPNELYDSEELAAFAGEAIAAYNEAQGAEAAYSNEGRETKLPVALKSCSLEGETGTLVFEYAQPEQFVTFSQETGDNTHAVTELSVAAVSKGNLPDQDMLKPDGKLADWEKAASTKNGRIVVVEGAATIYTEGKIDYVTAGVGVTGSNIAVTPEGRSAIVFH